MATELLSLSSRVRASSAVAIALMFTLLTLTLAGMTAPAYASGESANDDACDFHALQLSNRAMQRAYEHQKGTASHADAVASLPLFRATEKAYLACAAQASTASWAARERWYAAYYQLQAGEALNDHRMETAACRIFVAIRRDPSATDDLKTPNFDCAQFGLDQ